MMMIGGPIKFLPLLVLLLAGRSTAAPQAADTAQYGAFNDRVPDNTNNKQFEEYANFLTRFDEWVTGKKVPIPADPVTDALHQDLPPNVPNFSTVRVARTPAVLNHAVYKREDTTEKLLISKDKDFGEDITVKVPVTTESDPAYGSFIKELKRFDPHLVGHNVTIPHNTTADQVWNSGESKQ